NTRVGVILDVETRAGLRVRRGVPDVGRRSVADGDDVRRVGGCCPEGQGRLDALQGRVVARRVSILVGEAGLRRHEAVTQARLGGFTDNGRILDPGWGRPEGRFPLPEGLEQACDATKTGRPLGPPRSRTWGSSVVST